MRKGPFRFANVLVDTEWRSGPEVVKSNEQQSNKTGPWKAPQF